jgi:hypothetical protein
MKQETNKDNNQPEWPMIEEILTYYNQEEDKQKYLNIKKYYLRHLRGYDKLNEIKDYSEEQVDEYLKKYPPLNETDNSFYNFLAFLNLGQCAMKKELLNFFNKKDFSIYSLYKIAPRYIFELIETYKNYAPIQYKQLIDEHFILYCNIQDFFRPSSELLEKIMNDYINLSHDKLILLRFTEDEIIERQKTIEKIKSNKGSLLDNIYNFLFPKKEELKNVKFGSS